MEARNRLSGGQGSKFKIGVEFTANHPSNHHEFESDRAARNPTFQHPTLK